MKNYLTIEQLISQLQSYPKDLLVLVDGYEGGLDAIMDIQKVTVRYDDAQKWYYGPFEEDSKAQIKAIKIISTRGTRDVN